MKLRLRRPLAMLLTVVMLLGLLPTAAFAAEPRSSAELTTLTLTPASGESIDLMTNDAQIQWSILETWTLDLNADLVTGQESTLTVTLAPGMQFVNLDVEALKDRLGVRDAVWTPGTPDWAEKYENYEVKSGTLAVTFASGASSLENFQFSLKPDTDLFPPELSGEGKGLAIKDAISVKLDGSNTYSADVTATHNIGGNPFFGDVSQSVFNIPSGAESQIEITGYLYAGWPQNNGVLTKRLLRELSAKIAVPEGLTITPANALTVEKTEETDEDGNIIWTVTANNIFGISTYVKLDCTIPQEKAIANEEYVITIKHITAATEGQQTALETNHNTTAWTIRVKDPDAVYIKTENLSASNVYNFTKNGNEDGNFNDYHTVFAAVRLTNDGAAAIEEPLIYEAEFGQNVQFVTAVGIPCDWDNGNNGGLPTSITITWDDNSTTTITGADNIRAVASQFCYPGRGFMLLAKDLAEFENYGADKSIQAVKVELPGLPKDYASAGRVPIQEGASVSNAYSAAWGRVKENVADDATDTNKYRLYEKDAEDTDEIKQWTSVITTVKDSGQIANNDYNSSIANITIDGKSGTTAAGGDMVHVKQTIMPHPYHNGSTRPAETIIVDPVVYILQPEGLTLYTNQAEFTLSTGEDINYKVWEVTGEAKDVPDGWKIYEYTFTDSDGEPIVLGWYDGDWCNGESGIKMNANFTYKIPADATAATYDIHDLIFYKSSLNMPFVRNDIGDPYHLNEGKNIGSVAPSTFTVQPQPQFIITAQMQREGDGDTWYTYDPNNSEATTALLGDDDVVNVKITVTNRTGKEVDGVTVYVPVPKTDGADILGDYFIEDCGFDMVIASPPNLPEGWTAYYGDVTKVITKADNEAGIPSGEFQFTDSGNWSSGSYDNNTNLIRLDLNGTLADGETATLTLKLKPAGDTAQAGETNLFKTWYQFNAAGVVMTDTSKTSIFGAELQNGVVSGVVFADTNRNGVKDANEPGISGVEVSAVDITGRNYGPETTDKSGKYSFTSVPSNAVLTVTVKNPKDPDPNHKGGSYRFSPVGTGTEGVVSNVIAATDNKSASKSDVSLSGGTATVNAGLITPYTVRFVVTGGNASPDSVKIYDGQTLSEVLESVTVTPKKGDNFLDKWTKTPGNDGVQSSEVSHENLLNESVSADTTYTAQLKAESYTVEAQYRTSSTDDTMLTYSETVKYGEKPSESFPSDDTVKATAQEGYKFIGWKLSTSRDVLSRTEILQKEVTATATYIAQYAPKSGITVTLDPNGGKFGESEGPLTLTLTYGDVVATAVGYVEPTRDGHTFLGWAAAADSENVISNLTCPADNATYYAVWKESTYTITFQGYEQGSGIKTVQVKAGQAIGAEKIPEAKKTGAKFKGWSDGENTYSAEELAKVVPTANAIYTAQFTDVYTVTFYAGTNGTIDGSNSATRSVASGGTLSDIPTVAGNEGWYFVWWADARGTNVYTNESLKTLTITGPTSFYARYGQISGNTNITLHTPTADNPNSTTLTASLENDSATASYQWQKWNGTAWENIADVTGASLSLTGLKITDNGAKYQCVVTSGGNSATIGPVTLSVQKGNQDAPNVNYTDPSTIGGTGSIGTGDSKLTTAMEYKVGSDGDWTKVTNEVAASGIMNIASGTTYYIRYAETDYLNAGAAQDITIGYFNPTKEPTPKGSFEVSTMTLSGVENGQEYRIGDEGEWTEITGTTVDLSDAGLKDGDTIQIYKPGNGTTTTKSDTQIITLTQAAKPTGMATDETSHQGEDGTITITGYDSKYTYQISSNGGTTWTYATVGEGGVISGLAPGSYVIRVKGTGTMLASEPSDTLTVDPYVQSSEAKITSFKVTVDGKEYTGVIDQEAGTITVTLSAGTDPSVLNSLTPAIEYTGQSLTPASGTVQDFSSGGVTYTVTAENGTTKSYKATITIAQPDTYTITVADMEHGTITTDPSGTAAEGTEVTLTINPANGYKLKENSLTVTYTSDGGEQTVPVADDTFTMPAANVTVSAEFEAIEYSISYKLDGGTNAAGNPSTYTVENAIILSEPTWEGYIFQGWTWRDQTTPQQSVNIYAGSVTGDLTFTAHWQEDTPTPPTEYTVTVNGSYASKNSGTGSYAESATVTIQAGTREDYTFAGWTVTPSNVTLADDSNPTTTFTMPAENVTVTANWRENEPVPAGPVTVTPADIIIYMGGKDGYEGTVNDEGEIEASSSLPEPGFVFELPDDLENALAAAGEDITDVKFQNEDGTKTWIVQLYQGLDESAARKLYTIVPTYEDHDPVRVVFTDGDKHIVSDEFTVGLEINKDFGMSLYTGLAGTIKAVYGGKEYPVELGKGTLTVLGTTEKVSITTVTETAPTNGQAGATENAGTTYTINGSEVEVTGGDVSLLFDDIIDHIGNDRTSKLEARASKWLTDAGFTPSGQHQFVYELKYLDLVDANNGNAWVTASQDLTIYWPLPDGVDTSTVKVLHFKDLHRDMDTGEIEEEIEGCEVELRDTEIEGGYITFKVGRGGFSPFALVWEEDTPASSFTIEATVSGSGSITPGGTISVAAGSSQTITFAPDSGYYVSSVVVDGQSVSWTGNSYTFTNVTANHTITVTFAKSGGSSTTYYTIDAEAGQGGEISPDGRVRVARGSDKTFTITPDEGYRIADVLVDGRSIGVVSRYTFENVRSNHTIKVFFEKYSSVADPDDTGVSEWLDTSDHRDFLHGYTDGTFGPNRNMTRGEVAQMFYNLLLEQDVPQTTAFTDVPADMWCADAVNTLASLGIVEGIGNGLYAPDRAITRAEFTVIAMRFAELDTSGENIFSDVDTGDWFYEQVVGSIKYGWIQGYADGTFRPDNTITRAEVTTITNRMLGRAADEAFVDRHSDELRQFPDVPESYWAYYNIVEATNAHDFSMENGAENWSGLN